MIVRTDDSPPASDSLAAVIGRRWTQRLLAQTTLRHLGNAPLSELEELLPRPLARRLFASVRLGRDLVTLPRPRALDSTADAFELVRPLLEGRETERFVAIACDSRFRPLATEVVAEGTPVGVSVRIADAFAPAIRHRAPHLIVAHNHPSDDPAPSEPDLVLTQRLLDLGAVLGVALVDHIIVAGARFVSVRDRLPWEESSAMPLVHDVPCLDRSFAARPRSAAAPPGSRISRDARRPLLPSLTRRRAISLASVPAPPEKGHRCSLRMLTPSRSCRARPRRRGCLSPGCPGSSRSPISRVSCLPWNARSVRTSRCPCATSP